MDTDKDKKDRLRARLEQMTTDLRQRAIDMEEAITISRNLKAKDIEAQKQLIEDTEEKLRYYRQVLNHMLVQRWAEEQRRRKPVSLQATKERVFAQASTGDEAEGDVATPEERAFKLNGKTKEEVLESGSLLEKIRLYLCYFDDNGYADSKGKLTIEEEEQIRLSIKSKEDADKVRGYFNEYTELNRFGGQLRYYFKRYQTCFSALAKILNEWDSQDRIAQRLTDRARGYLDAPLKDGGLLVSEEDRRIAFGALLSLAYNLREDDILIQWDEKAQAFKANVYEVGGLYDKALQEAKETADALSDFKAIAVAANEFILKSELHYTPISIEIAVENVLQERYTRYLVKNLSYFRSEYLKRLREKGKGYRPTSDEKKRAIIPDFIETKPNKDFLRDARATLRKNINKHQNY